MNGFWTWALAHPFLTTIIALSITHTIQIIVKALRPERSSPSEQGPAQSAPEPEPEPAPEPPPRRQRRERQAPRRTAWDRLDEEE